MKKPLPKTTNGFTLIEILLYMALSTIMVVVMGGIGVNVFSGFVSARAAEELQYNTQFVTEKIHDLVTRSQSIITPPPGTSGPVLTLTNSDSTKNPTTIEVVDGRMQIKEGAEEPEFISGSDIDVSDLQFSNVTVGEGRGSVRVMVEMGLRNPEDRTLYIASSTVYTSVNMLYP